MTDDYSAYLDPIISLVYIITLVWSCSKLVKDSCYILLQTIPGNVEISLLKKYLLKKFPGILAFHEFHTWTFTPGTLVLTGHIVYQVIISRKQFVLTAFGLLSFKQSI